MEENSLKNFITIAPFRDGKNNFNGILKTNVQFLMTNLLSQNKQLSTKEAIFSLFIFKLNDYDE